jgi:hypothetical protein
VSRSLAGCVLDGHRLAREIETDERDLPPAVLRARRVPAR